MCAPGPSCGIGASRTYPQVFASATIQTPVGWEIAGRYLAMQLLPPTQLWWASALWRAELGKPTLESAVARVVAGWLHCSGSHNEHSEVR